MIDRADGSLSRGSWPTAIIGLAAVLLIVGIVRTAWLSDDALIIFRPVLNWLHGYGPVWNIDERVQAFTCPLWFLLLTIAVAATGELYVTTLLLSIGTALASVAVLALSAPRVGVWGLAFALTGLALSRSFIEFATSGLENPLSYLLLALTFVALEVQKSKDAAAFACVSLLFALSLINRLDLIVLLAPLGMLAVWRCGERRALLIGCTIGIAPLLAWFGFAVSYYGSVMPNTAYAKLGGGVAQIDMLRQGALYVLHSFSTDPVGAALILAGFASTLIERKKEHWALAVGIAAYLAYTAWVGGDFMVWRFISVPVFGAAVLVSRSRIAVPVPYALAAIAGLLTVSWYSGSPYLSPADFGPAQQMGTRGIVIERAWYYPSYGLLSPTQNFPDVTAWADPMGCNRREAPPIRIEYRIGIKGLEAGPCTHVIDVAGLADPLLARLPAIDVPDLRIGHFFRNLPAMYEQSIAADDNLLVEPAIRDLYSAVRLATRGPLWSGERWKAIGALALGSLNQPLAFASFRAPPFPTKPLSSDVRAAPYGPLRDGIDEEFYRSRNYDVSMLRIDPVEHYRTAGWREGRWPNTLFDPQYYTSRYSSVIPNGMEPLQHYLTMGWRDGFRPSAIFDPESYLALNPDVAAAGTNPMLHYLETGYREGRNW